MPRYHATYEYDAEDDADAAVRAADQASSTFVLYQLQRESTYWYIVPEDAIDPADRDC